MDTKMQRDFSLWLDFVERDFLQNAFKQLLKDGMVKGATSNPSIFSTAITTSQAYKEQLKTLSGESPKSKYEALAILDIKMAAVALREIYESSSDGYISIEVDPFLSNDTKATIAEGKRLFAAIGEPNVMIKIPATKAGYDAMEALMSEGISVNATLIFAPDQASEALKALKSGSEKFAQSSQARVDGVISVFVSRFDRMLDSKLEVFGIKRARTGILNAAKIYNIIEQSGAKNIRTLFASTGVKGDVLEADYYIRELLAPHAVNTAPLATLQAYQQNSSPKIMQLPIDETVIESHFEQLQKAGIDINEVYDILIQEGLQAFEESFEGMLANL